MFIKYIEYILFENIDIRIYFNVGNTYIMDLKRFYLFHGQFMYNRILYYITRYFMSWPSNRKKIQAKICRNIQ